MCLEVRSCLSFLPFRFFPRGKIHFPIAVSLWQSHGKAEKFDCDFLWLDALRGLTILVSVGFASCLYSADNINSSSSQRSCASFVSSR